MKNFLYLTCLFFAHIITSNAQEVTVKYTEDKIIIDGSPDDRAWQDAEVASDFWQWRPTDSVKAIKQTEFKALFDKENIYLLVKAYTKEKVIATKVTDDTNKITEKTDTKEKLIKNEKAKTDTKNSTKKETLVDTKQTPVEKPTTKPKTKNPSKTAEGKPTKSESISQKKTAQKTDTVKISKENKAEKTETEK